MKQLVRLQWPEMYSYKEPGLKLSWISAACSCAARPSADCNVTKGYSPSYREWGQAGRAPAPRGGGCLELLLSWVDTTGRPFAQHKAGPDRWWQLREKKGNKCFDFIHYHSVGSGLCVTDIQNVPPALLLTLSTKLLTAAGMCSFPGFISSALLG